MHDRAGLLPEWAVAELRRPLLTTDALRDRIMAGIRAAHPSVSAATRLGPSESARRGASVMRALAAPPTVRRRRDLRAMGATLALAASVVGMVASATLVRSHGESGSQLAGTTSGRMIVLGDSVDSALHDTLRLVRFVFDAPGAARVASVALAGDFNDWSRTATPLGDSAGSGAWSVVVALERGRGEGRYAFVVDDTQWVGVARSDDSAHAPAPLRAAPVGGDST